jgi:plasmid stabilization system protein ParE
MAHSLTEQAEADLDAIWWYIAAQSGSAERARSVVASITERFYFLAENPYAGRARDDDLGPGRRSYAVRRRYVIVYTVTVDNDVLVLRVAHGRQDLKALKGVL